MFEDQKNKFSATFERAREALTKQWQRQASSSRGVPEYEETPQRRWRRPPLSREALNRSRESLEMAWQQRSGFSAWMLAQYREFVAATSFLSVIPIPNNTRHMQAENSESYPVGGGGYFPLVGALLALLLCLVAFASSFLLPSLVVAALVVIVLVLLTGGLHLDGLMDTCDGIFGGIGSEHKMEIMRDSRVGAFGVLGAACVLLLKFATLASLNNAQLMMALLIVLPATRWGMVLAVYIFPSARPTGMGAAFRRTVTPRHLVMAGIVALAIALILGQFWGFLVWIIATSVALAIGTWAHRSLGGLTGDIYGAITEVSEVIAFLLYVFLL